MHDQICRGCSGTTRPRLSQQREFLVERSPSTSAKIMTKFQGLITTSIFILNVGLSMSGSRAIATEMSCQETVNSFIQDMQQQGTKITFRVDDDSDYVQFVKNRLDNQQRVHGLRLIFWESNPSDVALKNYAQQIFPRCGGTGIIDFAVVETEATISFAMSDKNQLGREACYEPTESIPPAISEIYREWDWYCAYVL